MLLGQKLTSKQIELVEKIDKNSAISNSKAK